jgi:hypothetical protein
MKEKVLSINLRRLKDGQRRSPHEHLQIKK